MTPKTKTPLPQRTWQRLTMEQRQEVRRFIQALDETPKPGQYVNPVALVLLAASQAEAMRYETYSIDLLHKLTEHNRTRLVPALTLLMQWALDLQLEVNKIDAKMIAQVKRKAGRHGK